MQELFGEWAPRLPWIILALCVIGMVEGLFRTHVQLRDASRMRIRILYWLTIALVVSVIFMVSTFVSHNLHPFAGLWSAFFLSLAFVAQGLEYASTDKPPETFVVTVFGALTNVIKRSGWRFFPLRGLVFGGIKIDTGVVNEDILTEDYPELHGVTYITADDVRGGAMLSFSYKVINPVQARTVKNLDGLMVIPIRNFIENRQQKGIRDILKDKVIDAFVRFMRGVPTWKDAYSLGNGLIVDLVKAIAGGDGIERTPSTIPTSILEKYFGIVKEPYTEEDLKFFEVEFPGKEIGEAIKLKLLEDEAGDEGIEAQEMITERELCDQHVPGEYEDFLKFFLIERRKKVEALKKGNGNIEIESLGIILTKVMIGARTTDPKVVGAAAKKAIELEDSESEMTQTRARLAQAQVMASDPNFKGTLDDAIRFQLIENGKMTSTHASNEYKLRLESDENAAEALKNAAPGIVAAAAAFSSKSGGGANPKGGNATKGGNKK